MKPEYKYSIIVGVYNQLATLPELVRSLKEQSFREFEVIFCDDGSSDGSVEYLLEARKDFSFASQVVTQPHKGMRLAKNLNNGIRRAEGEYCVLVMADSMLDTDYLEILNEYVNEERIVCGIRIQIDKDAEGKTQAVDMDWRLKKNMIPSIPSVIMGDPWNCLTGNGLIIPTSAFREHGLLCEEFEGYGGEDGEIVARLFFKGYICWSVTDLHLYHHWHKARDTDRKITSLIMKKIASYAA